MMPRFDALLGIVLEPQTDRFSPSHRGFDGGFDFYDLV